MCITTNTTAKYKLTNKIQRIQHNWIHTIKFMPVHSLISAVDNFSHLQAK